LTVLSIAPDLPYVLLGISIPLFSIIFSSLILMHSLNQSLIRSKLNTSLLAFL
jgi:hypothetical protein